MLATQEPAIRNIPAKKFVIQERASQERASQERASQERASQERASQETPLKRVRFRPTIRTIRRSLIDPTIHGDPWVTGCYLPNCLILYVNNQPVSLLAGSPLDQSTFNSMLHSMRGRYPRNWRRAVA